MAHLFKHERFLMDMAPTGLLRHIHSRHPRPVRNTPTREEVKDELHLFKPVFADECMQASYLSNQITVSQVQHYVRVIELIRYAAGKELLDSYLEQRLDEWVTDIGDLRDLGRKHECRIASQNARLWETVASPRDRDSVYQAGMESYHLGRHMLERSKTTQEGDAKAKVVDTLSRKLDIVDLVRYSLESNVDFQRDALREQRRFVCRELTKKRPGFAKTEAQILKQMGRIASRRDILQFASYVIQQKGNVPEGYRNDRNYSAGPRPYRQSSRGRSPGRSRR